LLGPLEVFADEKWTGVHAPKWRALLAALLIEPGRVIPTGSLVDELWGDDPPAGARKLVSGYVLRLRRLISDPDGRVLVTQAPGYRFMAAREELDTCQFEDLLAAGRRSLEDDNAEQAASLLATALALWRGPALADVPQQRLVAAEADRLEELRLAAVELRIEADIRCGHQAELVSELRQLTAGHPLQERFWHQLMRVLDASGRPAEALEVYIHARDVIAGELGADPGPELQQLHYSILGGDLGHTPPRSAVGQRPVALAPQAIPRQLSAGVRHFVGRAEELARLSAFLGDSPEPADTMVISVIGGTAGVGKTALAVRWAHQVADRFPDGQLHVNLRGYDLGQPMLATDALAGFLRALGVAGREIPPEMDERAALYRSLLAGRRMLVMLDNAGSVEQVRPLLPGAPACAVVVTSRDALGGLVARDGARRLDLDLLPLSDAVGLLRALVGPAVEADPVAAATLASRCCRLPLALRVAAELAADRPDASLADLAGELADQQRQLDLLDAGGDPRTAMRAVFSGSYRHLDARAARAFRLAGLHPGPDLDSYAAAALTGSTVEQASLLLGLLARAHLLQPAGPGRYGMHDLLRAYARELVTDQDGETDRRAALTRLFDHYLHAAAVAMDTLVPAERHRRPCIPSPATPSPPVTGDPGAARAWLDIQRAILVAVAAYTATQGWPGHATRLSATLAHYLDAGGHYPEAITIHTHARRAARRIGDHAAEATPLTSLGFIDVRQGRYQRAAGHLRQALTLFRETGDRSGEARALGNLGNVNCQQGHYQEAAAHLRQALTLFRETGDRSGEARTLGNLGFVEVRQGRHQQAADHLQQALAVCRQTSDRSAEGRVLINLGLVTERQGRQQQAADHLQRALTLFREIGDPSGTAYALTNFGDVDGHRGRWHQAAGHQREALDLFRGTGDRSGEAAALNGLGEVSLATGQPGPARTEHTTALSVASQIGDQYQQARAHNGLARYYRATGHPGQARRHWEQALARYTGIGAPEADQVRAQLAAADGYGQP
jgi:DNA-binding SARP family transcriptional activator/tetratricopeptide (TPR) repeat protein